MNYRKAAAEAVASALDSQQISAEQAERLMTVPPNPEMGDIAFPCFSLAKQFRKAPPQIAAELQRSILESPEAGSIFLKVEFLSKARHAGQERHFGSAVQRRGLRKD